MDYQRVKKNAQFQSIFKKGKRAFSPALTLVWTPSEEICMGVAVSKKHGKAVKRNRIKRLLREAFQRHVKDLKRNVSVILIPKQSVDYSLAAFEESLLICFKAIK